MLDELMRYVEFSYCKVGDKDYKKLNWSGNMLELTQNADYRDTLYTLTVKGDYGVCAVKRVELIRGGKAEEIAFSDDKFSVSVDFENKAEKLVLYFKYDLCDPLELSLKYVDADRAAWDKHLAEEEAARLENEREEKRQNIIKAADIYHRTGENLVNIYFQPCSEDYSKTVISLYTGNNLMAQYECEKGVYFKSVTGLAYGGYDYTVSQYDGAGNLIFCSDKKYFSLDKPYSNTMPPNVNGNW